VSYNWDRQQEGNLAANLGESTVGSSEEKERGDRQATRQSQTARCSCC
jgi:hypothetical protein